MQLKLEGNVLNWAKFKELSFILTARCASYHIEGEIYRACAQSVLKFVTEA